MPERVYHLKKATYNLDVSRHLNAETPYRDWAVTSLFYAALHKVDALLAAMDHLPKDEKHPRKHSASAAPGNGGRGRNQLVAAEMRPINKEYRSLHEASRRSRYDMETLDAQAYERLMDQYRVIEKYVAMQLLVRGAA